MVQGFSENGSWACFCVSRYILQQNAANVQVIILPVRCPALDTSSPVDSQRWYILFKRYASRSDWSDYFQNVPNLTIIRRIIYRDLRFLAAYLGTTSKRQTQATLGEPCSCSCVVFNVTVAMNVLRRRGHIASQSIMLSKQAGNIRRTGTSAPGERVVRYSGTRGRPGNGVQTMEVGFSAGENSDARHYSST